MPGQSPHVAVVMLTLNQCDMTLRCLESLRAAGGPDFDVVLWDNGSLDATVERVEKQFPDVCVHRHPTNLGVASGRNAAAELAISRFAPSHLLFLDNDMVVTAGFVGELLSPFATGGKLGQTQAKLRLLKDPERLNDGGGIRLRFWLGSTAHVGFGEVDRGQYDRPARCIACGGATLVRVDVFRQLGGFDPAFDPVGPEDIDFSLRLRQAGYDALYVPQALAYHAVSHSFGAGYPEHYARLKVRHWLRLMRRHASLGQRLAFVFAGAPYSLARMILRETRRGNPGAVRGAVRGAVDFCKSMVATRGSGRDSRDPGGSDG